MSSPTPNSPMTALIVACLPTLLAAGMVGLYSWIEGTEFWTMGSLIFLIATFVMGIFFASSTVHKSELHPEVLALVDEGEIERAVVLQKELCGSTQEEAERLISLAKVPLNAEVQRLAQAGEKIRAIKLHRTLTGCGLAEAKSAIDRYCARIK